MAEVHWSRDLWGPSFCQTLHSCWKHSSACSRRTFPEYCCRRNILRTKCLTQCSAVNRDTQGRSLSVLMWVCSFQLCGVKERIPPLQGATLQLLGQALCGGSPSLRFYLQQWQRSCRKRSYKLIHSSGGIQWGSTGNGKGQSESCCSFTYKARTLQVAVHLYRQVGHLWSKENGSELSEGPAHKVPSLFRVSYGFGHQRVTLTAVTHQISF